MPRKNTVTNAVELFTQSTDHTCKVLDDSDGQVSAYVAAFFLHSIYSMCGCFCLLPRLSVCL